MKISDANLGRMIGLACVVAAIPAVAYAADGSITIPYGQLFSDWQPVFAAVLAGLVAWGFRQLPGNVAAILGNGRVELLLNNAINYGLNAVAGAAKGKTLDVNVGNKVLAEALQYAIDNAPKWLLTWAGGPEGLAKKIWGRLDLDPAADASGTVAAVAATAAAKA
jgi:hypothetical protein